MGSLPFRASRLGICRFIGGKPELAVMHGRESPGLKDYAADGVGKALVLNPVEDDGGDGYLSPGRVPPGLAVYRPGQQIQLILADCYSCSLRLCCSSIFPLFLLPLLSRQRPGCSRPGRRLALLWLGPKRCLRPTAQRLVSGPGQKSQCKLPGKLFSVTPFKFKTHGLSTSLSISLLPNKYKKIKRQAQKRGAALNAVHRHGTFL